MSDFHLEHVSIGLSNKAHFGLPAFAECYVSLGAFRLRAYLLFDGRLSIDTALTDERIKTEIAVAFRASALQKLADQYTREDRNDRERLAALEALPRDDSRPAP